jgi:hypothetical protein
MIKIIHKNIHELVIYENNNNLEEEFYLKIKDFNLKIRKIYILELNHWIQL